MQVFENANPTETDHLRVLGSKQASLWKISFGAMVRCKDDRRSDRKASLFVSLFVSLSLSLSRRYYLPEPIPERAAIC